MHTRNVLPFKVSGFEQRNDFVEMKIGRIHDAFRTMSTQHRLRHERSSVQDDRTCTNDALAFHRDEFGISGSRANEIDRHLRGFIESECEWDPASSASRSELGSENSRSAGGRCGRCSMTTGKPRSRATASFASVAAPPLFLLTRTSVCCASKSMRSLSSENG